MAQSNGELIEQARRVTEEVGRRPAAVEEARELLEQAGYTAGEIAALRESGAVAGPSAAGVQASFMSSRSEAACGRTPLRNR